MSQEKQAVAMALLHKGPMFIHLDPRALGVVIPPWLMHQDHVVLEVGYNMSIPIDDLETTSLSISGTLSFARTPFHCYVPWYAVFALVGDNHTGCVWEADMPPAVKEMVKNTTKGEVAHGSVATSRATKHPHLRLIHGGKSSPTRPPRDTDPTVA